MTASLKWYEEKCKQCIHLKICESNEVITGMIECDQFEENRQRRLSINIEDDQRNFKAIESAIEMIRNVANGSIVPIEWHEIKTRPLTDEEREDPDRPAEYDMILECLLPDDGETVLISGKYGVSLDDFCRDIDGCYFENNDVDDVKAWAHLPKPFEKT